jgi:hypothetical protein
MLTSDGPADEARPVVLRESSVVLGSLASVALSPTEARRIGRIVAHDPKGPRHYPFPFPAGCRAESGNASRETAVRWYPAADLYTRPCVVKVAST